MTEFLTYASAVGSAISREAVLSPVPGQRQIAIFPKTVRGLVTECLPRWGLASFVEDARLVASELATNAVQHAPDGPLGFAVKYAADVLRVEVTDGSAGDAVPRLPSADEERGRGLQLVEHVADVWGCERNPDGTKTIWCQFVTYGDRP